VFVIGFNAVKTRWEWRYVSTRFWTR